jgi:hypothetical protein
MPSALACRKDACLSKSGMFRTHAARRYGQAKAKTVKSFLVLSFKKDHA